MPWWGEEPRGRDGSRGLCGAPRQGPIPGELEQALRTRAKKTLNTYLIPAAYHFLAELPLTPRGKLDYRTLEAWAAEQEEHP